MTDLAQLVERADIDGLLRRLDELVDRGDWSTVARLRRMCEGAAERGRQLWPVVSHAEYRTALSAPAADAAAVITEGAGHFALGPLTEVAASTHSWSELGGELDDGPLKGAVAAERVVRGERVDHPLPDLPDRLQPWEPDYPLAVYHPHRAEFDPPPPDALSAIELDRPAERLATDDSITALRELVTHWVTQSNGRVDAVAVAADAVGAISALGVRRARAAPISGAAALAWLAWAAANGGAHGRRRGMALGRWEAWWCASRLAGFDEWPVDAEALGAAVGELEWWRWDGYEPPGGWRLQLAVVDRADGLAWAISAIDAD